MMRNEAKPLLGDTTTPPPPRTRSSSRRSRLRLSSSLHDDAHSHPRSPFETGIPMMFPSPNQIPSPRPHRLSFSYDKHDRYREFHVFLTLLMSVVGAGMLSVPYTFVLVPTWQAMVGIIMVGIGMGLTANALLHAHVHLASEEESVLHIGAGRRFSSFQSIAIVAGGDALGYLVSIVTAIGIYGGCVGCIRIVRDIAPFLVALVYSWISGNPSALAVTEGTQMADWVMWISFVLIVFPLCLLKNLSGLRVSSYLGFAFSIYLVIAVIYRSFHALDEATEQEARVMPTVVIGSIISRFAQSISIYNYAFMMHLNLIPLFIQLRGSFADPLNQSRRKMTKCIMGVVVFCIVLYAAFGLFAERLYDGTIRGNILLNLENDLVMEIPLVAVYLTVILSFPLLFHPLRGVIEELVFTTTMNDIAFSTRLMGTSVLLLSQLLIAIWVPGIEVVFAFTGASSCLMICFVFPVVLFTRLVPWRQRMLSTVVLWLVVVLFTCSGAIATWFLLAHH